MSEEVFEFTAEGLVPAREALLELHTTLVADSWLVNDGAVVGLDRHYRRFSSSVLAHTSITARELELFLSELTSTLPLQGRWFPRIEVLETPEGHQLHYRKRVAPQRSSEVVIARASHDPRRNTQVKGPDLSSLMALRSEVASTGAGEAVIVDALDHVIEGAYSTVLVWGPGEDGVTMVPRSVGRLPSVTEDVLCDLLRAQGFTVEEKMMSVAELHNSEVWIVSALQGIRLATTFVGGPTLSTNNPRAPQWQALWEELAAPVRSP